MTETTTIRVDFISESAAFRNTFGWYNSVTGEGGILYAGVEAQGSHPTVVPGVSHAEFSVDTDDLNNIQFFLIANGDGIRKNTDEELSGPVKVIQLANGTWAVATVDEDGNVETDHFGRPNILVGAGANAFFTETAKNAGGVDYASSTVGPGQTAATLAGDTADGLTGIVAWEDLAAKLRRNGTYTQPGDADYNDAVFQVSIVNQPPAAVADSNADDPVVEAGVGPDAAPLAGDPSAAGNVLANDSDADGDTVTVVGVAVGNVAGPVSGNVGTSLTGTYGTLTLGASGSWAYALDNADPDTDALASGQTFGDVFTYTISDGHGGTATTTLTVDITGTNDAPVITGGTTTGAVQEDGTFSATGALAASDVDNGALLTWSVSGGVSVVPSDFEIGVDQLKVTKGGSVVFEDNFDDGMPPPSLSNDAGTPFATSYGVGGTIVEVGGRAVLDYANGFASLFFGSPDPGVFNGFLLASNVDPADPVNGLKLATDFEVEARFDLSMPDDNREHYGIRLADRQIGGGGNPPDQIGDDVVDLVVRRDISGDVFVTFRELDFATETVANIQVVALTPPPGADQIVLRLTHEANAQAVQASFDYLSAGAVVGTHSFAGSASIFTNETWTRAQIIATAPEQATSALDADYGTPTIDQFGNWTYTLANDRTNVQALAEGQTAIDAFTVQVTDEHGASATQAVNVTVTGDNDAPFIQSGSPTQPAQRFFAEIGDLAPGENATVHSATGLIAFLDRDLIDTHIATVTELGSGYRGVMTASVTTDSTDGHGGYVSWTFAVDDSALDTLAQDQTLVQDYVITVDDGHGGTDARTVRVNITGTNDAPVITSGPGSGTVTENGSLAVSDLMTAFDPDDGAVLTWTVVGGTAPQAADYEFFADNFRISKNGGGFLEDTFDDGLPPPSSPPFANGDAHTYGLNGTFLETGGRLILDSDNAAPIVSVGTPDPFIGNFASVRSNIDPANLERGLKSDDDFTVEGLFDLIIPDSPREVYGIRLSDRLVGGPGTPPDQLGDDQIELVMRKAQDGIVRVQLREIDTVNDQVVNIGAVPIAPPPGTDQILLRLTHSTTDVGALHASFDYLSGGVVIDSVSLAQVGRIFGAETPGFTGDDENWTRANIFAYAPTLTDTTLAGTYGSLTIGQGGAWTYALANNQVNVQNLAQGETATDTFTVEVTDEFGASDTETISITVVGSNDAPVIITGPVVRAVDEDSSSPIIAQTGLSFFFDIDLADTHTVAPSFVSATLSDGASVPPDVLAAALGALSTTLIDPATGDSDGQYRWDFALDNGLVQFLAEGQTLALAYNVTALDNHGAASTQTVTINVTGTNDVPQITTGPVTTSVTENVSPVATGTMAAFDPDTGAQEFWTVVGGTGAAAASYTFLMDNLSIIKNGSSIFEDPFSDGSPPPSSPNFANGQAHTYAVNGGFQEAGDKLIIDAADASLAVSVGTPDQFVGNFALVRSNIDPADLVAGLKSDDDFTVEGLFDLVEPDSPREVYGIRLTDRLIGGPGTPPDQLGDDAIELVVRQGVDGIVRVQLREFDFVNDQVVNIGGVVLAAPPGADQILLRLTHSTTDVGALHASFDYLAGGVVIGSESLAQVGRIFGTETPGFTGDDENWTRAQVVAYAPAITDSTLAGAYGTLTIDQAGVWTYNLANDQIGVQNLAEGETAVDTFTVQVADEHGASDTETISVTVVGTNDPPIIQTGPVSRDLDEGEASTLTATGEAVFFDVDLIDTHTFAPSLTSATLSSGVIVPAGVLTAAGSALSATLIDPATDDGVGHYRWDFALDNAVVDFLASVETLTLTYDVAAMDNHGGTDTQQVTINIEGTDDWLLVA